MIEFNGYISGAAKKRFLRKWKNRALNSAGGTILAMFPVFVILSIIFRDATLVAFYAVIMFAFVLLLLLIVSIPKSEKAIKAMITKRIRIDDGRIICTTDKGSEIVRISDVRVIREYDEFYEMDFSFFMMSEKFICQKNLLTQGTLEDFEKMFEDKLAEMKQ